jgi:hypothetical protein
VAGKRHDEAHAESLGGYLNDVFIVLSAGVFSFVELITRDACIFYAKHALLGGADGGVLCSG